MKTIGMVGGTGWLSTVEYYRIINQETNRRLGGLNSAKLVIVSLNYSEIEALNDAEDYAGVYKLVLDAAIKLRQSAVDGLMLCANTLHQYVDELENEIDVPFIHIAEAAAKEIKKKRLTKIGLLGTRLTMEMDFYTKRLEEAGIQTLVPEKPEREFIQSSIMTELLVEEFKPETKARFINIISDLEKQGAQGIVLGCTEIPLLIKQEDTQIPVFNTLEIHARAAVDFAI